MTAANWVGLSRIPLTIAGSWFVLMEGTTGRRAAAAIVVLAMVSDILDGRLARWLGTVSTFGAILDLTTDKVFVIPMLFLAARDDAVLLWMVMLIALRDILMMGVRMYAAAESVVIPARRLGKLKALLAYPALLLIVLGIPQGAWVLGAATVMAFVSGIDYLREAWPVLSRGLFPPPRTSARRP